MLEKRIIDKLNICGSMVFTDISGKTLSTFRSGGRVGSIIYPSSRDSLFQALYLLKEDSIDFAVLGNGSNTLISDDGYDGTIIKLKKMNDIIFENNIVYAYGGAQLSKLCLMTGGAGMSGLEWAVGIPASVGGAAVMNAGCYGREFADVIEFVDVIIDEKPFRLAASEMAYGYRDSLALHKKMLIIGVGLKLVLSSERVIFDTMEQYHIRRNRSQPNEPSLGSVFRRINNQSAAYYLDRLGFKGTSVGGAKISDKHAGFIINYNHATSDDYLSLAKLARDTIYKQYDLLYNLEINYLGEPNEVLRRLSYSHEV